MHRIGYGLATAAALLGLSATATHAASPQPEDEAFQQRLFGGRVLAKTPLHACFGRAYDANHLVGHPGQKVRTMRLLFTARNGGFDNGPTYDLAMGVTFRRSGTHFATNGSCGSIHDQTNPGEGGKVAHCGVDCDEGTITVSLKDEGSVLVAIPNGASTSSPQGEADGPRFGIDDKLFRLDKASLKDCLSLAPDSDVKRALRRGE